ncbi:hypothetical protein ACHQM5_007145 [Ranunculus cassubicifolius]
MSNGNLYDHLHVGKMLSWENRVKVANGVARALDYLHHGCNPRVIHADIKSGNVSLDDMYEPRVADFGLAILRDKNAPPFYTTPRGTPGYIDPYFDGTLSEINDVYAYGILLLEIVTGREPSVVAAWAAPLLETAVKSGDFSGLADPSLLGSYDKGEMRTMLNVAAAYISKDFLHRPTMEKVLNKLELQRRSFRSSRIKFFQRTRSSTIRELEKVAFSSESTPSANAGSVMMSALGGSKGH